MAPALPRRLPLARACGAFLALILALPALAAEDGVNEPSDPCGFYRTRAYGQGLEHFSTEMLWACEAIAARRAAGIALGERMRAVELALERYRLAVVADASLRAPRDGRSRRAEEAALVEVAERTGTLAALEAIRAGF